MKKETRLVFTGDIGFDHYMEGRYDDESLLEDAVFNFLRDSDHLIVNVEGALSNGSKKPSANSVKQLMHSMKPEVSRFLKRIGADVWCICNNHIMDAGSDGLSDTLKVAKESGAKTIGAGMNLKEAAKPLILDEAGGIGIFAVGYQRACRKAEDDKAGCLSWSDMDTISANISEIKSKCRWCIVVAHGGEEFTSLPSPYTRDRYLEYLRLGADAVVAHHPHVPMNYETVGDKIIFYSLGNFVFDTDYQRTQFNTEKGLFVKLRFTEDNFSFEPMGIEINRKNERVVKSDLPLIFTDVQPDEYKLLEPLSAKAFISATKRQQIYLNPDKFKNATDDEWHEHFLQPMRSGRVPGEALDFHIILPIAEQADAGEWKKSSLEGVKKYILEQI